MNQSLRIRLQVAAAVKAVQGCDQAAAKAAGLEPEAFYELTGNFPDEWENALSWAQETLLRGTVLPPAEESKDPVDIEELFNRFLASREDYRPLKPRSQDEYRTTLRRLLRWVDRKDTPASRCASTLDGEAIRRYLRWVAAKGSPGSSNAGRIANKDRSNLQAVLKWASRSDVCLLSQCPDFPQKRPQRSQAGIGFLEFEEIDRLYEATYRMPVPVGWGSKLSYGAYWRCALVLFYNLALDTVTLFPRTPEERESAIHRSDVYFQARSPSRQIPMTSKWGWIWWQRKKTGRRFERPINDVMYWHLKPIIEDDRPETLLMSRETRFDKSDRRTRKHYQRCMRWFHTMIGGDKPNKRFQKLCELADIEPRIDPETRKLKPWNLKDLRKTSGAWHELYGSSGAAEALGHSDSAVTFTHYVSRDIAASQRLLTLPQPESFKSVMR